MHGPMPHDTSVSLSGRPVAELLFVRFNPELGRRKAHVHFSQFPAMEVSQSAEFGVRSMLIVSRARRCTPRTGAGKDQPPISVSSERVAFSIQRDRDGDLTPVAPRDEKGLRFANKHSTPSCGDQFQLGELHREVHRHLRAAWDLVALKVDQQPVRHRCMRDVGCRCAGHVVELHNLGAIDTAHVAEGAPDGHRRLCNGWCSTAHANFKLCVGEAPTEWPEYRWELWGGGVVAIASARRRGHVH